MNLEKTAIHCRSVMENSATADEIERAVGEGQVQHGTLLEEDVGVPETVTAAPGIVEPRGANINANDCRSPHLCHRERISASTAARIQAVLVLKERQILAVCRPPLSE